MAIYQISTEGYKINLFSKEDFEALHRKGQDMIYIVSSQMSFLYAVCELASITIAVNCLVSPNLARTVTFATLNL